MKIQLLYIGQKIYEHKIVCGLLTNYLKVPFYELRVTIFYTSYELLFPYQFRVTIDYTSYELVFTYEL